MLNKILGKKVKTIIYGIAVSITKESVVKNAREDFGINNLVWIWEALIYKSKLSSM